jgi:hypothetical protein
MFRPGVVIVIQGTPEWDALAQAMDQYTENTRVYIEECEPGEDPETEAHLESADVIMDGMNAAVARLAE